MNKRDRAAYDAAIERTMRHYQGTTREGRMPQTLLQRAMDCPFTRSYLETALWSSMEYDGDGRDIAALDENYGLEDIATECLRSQMQDCAAFMLAHWEDIAGNLERAGHDFWLTRNRHGAGFWDGDWPKDVGQRLTDASNSYGCVDLWVGNDGKVYGD